MCWYCGSEVTNPEPIGRSARCPDCGKDIRVCKSCRFHLPQSRGRCSETRAESIEDDERANFCDWFSFDPKFRKKSPGEKGKQNAASSARTSFDSLFNT